MLIIHNCDVNRFYCQLEYGPAGINFNPMILIRFDSLLLNLTMLTLVVDIFRFSSHDIRKKYNCGFCLLVRSCWSTWHLKRKVNTEKDKLDKFTLNSNLILIHIRQQESHGLSAKMLVCRQNVVQMKPTFAIASRLKNYSVFQFVMQYVVCPLM